MINKAEKNISNGRAYIKASFNNTIIYISDLDGNILAGATAGTCGFKGSRKGTPHAAQVAAKSLAKHVKIKFLLHFIKVYVNGPGPGGDSAMRGLGESLNIMFISNTTGYPHNGCRPKKERRV